MIVFADLTSINQDLNFLQFKGKNQMVFLFHSHSVRITKTFGLKNFVPEIKKKASFKSKFSGVIETRTVQS